MNEMNEMAKCPKCGSRSQLLNRAPVPTNSFSEMELQSLYRCACGHHHKVVVVYKFENWTKKDVKA